MKEEVEEVKTGDIANFTLALIESFNFLKNVNKVI